MKYKGLYMLALCAVPLAAQQNLETTVLSAGSTGSTTTSGRVTLDGNNILTLDSTGASSAQWPISTRTFIGPMPSLQQIRLEAKPIPVASLAPAAYLKLAMKINLESATTDEIRMLDAIYGLNLKTYDFSKVDDYMYRKAVESRSPTRWVWKPMRESDKSKTDKAIGLATWRRPAKVANDFGVLSVDLYARAIPARVLETVASVLAKLPDALFVVSDYEATKPDPFLAVTTQKLLDEGKIWIIDVWAEPGFTDEVTGAKPVI